MNKNLFLLTILMGLLLSSILKAENILYCESELATGFFKEDRAWIESGFNKKRFTVKFNDDYTKLEGISYAPMDCSIQYKTKPSTLFCVHLEYEYKTFVFDRITKRFLFSSISSGSYVRDETNNNDTENLYAGSCQTF